ncbi:MAG: flippase-like domain-containing protein [Candidatus Omnitrophica bacterium]|nr:flippase-like domain-containing protein [Candidatus Omnitrophota bacterium]
MKEKFKAVWSFFLRFGLSAALLTWLFSRIDYKHTWAAVKGADKSYLLAAFAVFFVTNMMILGRWMILMKALRLQFKDLSGVRWFFIGLFCNLFLPTSVGGDVIKALGLAKETGYRPKVFASIVLDRLTGFTAIVLVAFVSFFFGRQMIGDSSLIIAIVCMAGVSLGLAVVLFSHRIFSWACKAFKTWPRIKEGLMSLHYDIVLMRGKQKQFVATVGISALAQIVLAYDFYLTAQGMHQHISFVYFIIFSPLVCVVTSLPSIGGLGVREIGWVYLLSKVGVPQGVALGLSLINFAFMILVGLVGGIWYVASFSTGRLQHYPSDARLKPWHA